MNTREITQRIQYGRKIEGMSAVLLPFDGNGRIDEAGLTENIGRTVRAGITPAVNMDTGYANLINDEERRRVLALTRETVWGGRFVAGAYIEGRDGSAQDLYARAVDEITEFGGTPIIFQSTKLKALDASEKIALYSFIGERCGSFLAFELGEMFLPFGEIYSLELMRELMQIPALKGAKHSSLSRELEWQRLQLRDEVRPDFKVYTGNDLAIDMVMYGSDYLLGLSAFSPEAFALRDRLWEQGAAAFYSLNDLLQYLGFFTFRPPVPAYKHNAAQFLHLRGRIATNSPHSQGTRRPESDIDVLRDISERLDATVAAIENRGS